MWNFNLLVTLAVDGRFYTLLRELSLHGDFHKNEYYGTILGQVPDPLAFLDLIRSRRADDPQAFAGLGRIIPFEHCFLFTPATFLPQLQAALTPYVVRLFGQHFYVRLERRGLKGRLISPEIERALDAFLLNLIHAGGGTAQIDFAEPDTIIAIETFGERGGIALLTRSLRELYPFVHVP
jgi:hypothetical protein